MSAIMKHDMKAILGEDFFKEEVRCEYLINAEMKQVFAVLLDLYLIFEEICDKHGLRYYANSGFLLGAIRHKGFIPWDDDIDVAMPREDYEKFMEIAPKELSSPYFLRTPFTDKGSFFSTIVLMNLSTTFVLKCFQYNSFRMGIGMDIFPLDYCDPSTFDDDRAQIYYNVMCCSGWMKASCKNMEFYQPEKYEHFKTTNPLENWKKVHEIATNPKYRNSGYLGISALTILKKEQSIYPISDFDKAIMWPFESIQVPVPVGYDNLLTIQYGDYMKYPPVEERGRKNDQIIFDPNHSYTDYLIK